LYVKSKDNKSLELKRAEFKDSVQDVTDHCMKIFEMSEDNYMVTPKTGQAAIGILITDFKMLD